MAAGSGPGARYRVKYVYVRCCIRALDINRRFEFAILHEGQPSSPLRRVRRDMSEAAADAPVDDQHAKLKTLTLARGEGEKAQQHRAQAE